MLRGWITKSIFILSVVGLPLPLAFSQISLPLLDPPDFSTNTRPASLPSTEEFLQTVNKELYKSVSTPSHINSAPKKNTVSSWNTTNLWEELIQGFNIADTSRFEVQDELHSYLQLKELLNQSLENATPYLFFIYQEIRVRRLPNELILLPIVESNYNPFAYSKAGASGLWQLIPVTASHYGFEMNWWYDANRDVILSTKAALDYLQDLHQVFKDWPLAIAAYNAGISTVKKAQKANRALGKGTDFWSLPLPNETKHYVSKFLALSILVKNAKNYDLTLPQVSKTPFFTSVAVNNQITLSSVSHLTGTSLSLIKRLNPGLRRAITMPNASYTLLIPTQAANNFIAQLQNMVGEKQIIWVYHEVRKGETLQSISHNYKTSPIKLKQMNQLKKEWVFPTQGLLVPLRSYRIYDNPAMAAPQGSLGTQDELAPGPLSPDNLKNFLEKIYPDTPQ